jgi:outer membrane protein assembly factor BamB
MKNKVMLPIIIVATMLVITGINSNAQDWAQWRGQNREGVVKAAGINLNWTEKKPPLAWTFRQAGAGYSAPVIVGTTLYCQGAADGNDFAFALDTRTGNLKWKQTLGAEFVMDRGNGPRGSVTVDGDKLYLVRGGGQIHCLSAADGKTIWQKDFRKDLGGNIMSQWDWGYSESPLVDGNLVICTPGDNQGTMAALDKNTGDVIWRSIEWTDLGGYSSPVVAEVDGIRQYIQLTRNGVAGVAAKDGKLLWKTNVAGNMVAVIPTPIYHDRMVYVTSGYNAGCAAIRLIKEGDSFKAETVYANRNMSNHHGVVVLMNGYIDGVSDSFGWVCQNFPTGENGWNQRRIGELGKGAVLGVNNRLLCLDERTGLLAVLAASPDGVQQFGTIEIPERSKIESLDNMVWTHPVIADGKLFLRDHNLLFCFDLK